MSRRNFITMSADVYMTKSVVDLTILKCGIMWRGKLTMFVHWTFSRNIKNILQLTTKTRLCPCVIMIFPCADWAWIWASKWELPKHPLCRAVTLPACIQFWLRGIWAWIWASSQSLNGEKGESGSCSAPVHPFAIAWYALFSCVFSNRKLIMNCMTQWWTFHTSKDKVLLPMPDTNWIKKVTNF